MKRFIYALLLALVFVSGVDAATLHYAQGLTGGGATDLDAFDGNTLDDGDFCFTFDGTNFYAHRLDATSGAAESSPNIIAPDTNPGTKRWILQNVYSVISGVHPPTGVEITGFMAGLVFANGTDANHDVNISAGACMDSTGVYHLSSSSTVAKQLDAAWVAYTTPSTPSGGLLNGSIAANTLYHIYALRKDSDGSVDFGFLKDGDSIATYLPSGYTYYRWVGFVVTDGSSNIRGFILNHDQVVFNTGFKILSSVNTSSLTAQSISSSTPSGRVSMVTLSAYGCGANGCFLGSNSTEASVRIPSSDTNQWNATTNDTNDNIAEIVPAGGYVFVNTSSWSTDIFMKRVTIIR